MPKGGRHELDVFNIATRFGIKHFSLTRQDKGQHRRRIGKVLLNDEYTGLAVQYWKLITYANKQDNGENKTS